MEKTIYDEYFFSSQSGSSIRSASAVVPIILKTTHPKSIVDVGCGIGTWLKVFREHGVKDVLGIDGAYVNNKDLLIPSENFLEMDLANPSQVYRKFELAICLEVAEHIAENNAINLIKFLTSLTPIIFFSAAIPGQGGASHINEQWPDYWREHFSKKGYCMLDIIRSQIWNFAEVEPWYCQNAFIYMEQQVLLNSYPELLKSTSSSQIPLRLVHPELFRRFYSLEYVSSKKMFLELWKRHSRTQRLWRFAKSILK